MRNMLKPGPGDLSFIDLMSFAILRLWVCHLFCPECHSDSRCFVDHSNFTATLDLVFDVIFSPSKLLFSWLSTAILVSCYSFADKISGCF